MARRAIQGKSDKGLFRSAGDPQRAPALPFLTIFSRVTLVARSLAWVAMKSAIRGAISARKREPLKTP